MSEKISDKVARVFKKYHLYAFKDVAIFMVILVFFHIVWRLFNHELLLIDFINSSANWLAQQVFNQSSWILSVTGVNVVPFDELTISGVLRKNVFICAENSGFVYVNSSCSGLKQFYQWFFLMLLYPGPWKHKLWFFPLGILIVHMVNVFRIIGMVFVTMYLPQHWDFIHDWIMRPFFYVVMFLLWVWWNERFYLKNKKSK